MVQGRSLDMYIHDSRREQALVTNRVTLLANGRNGMLTMMMMMKIGVLISAAADDDDERWDGWMDGWMTMFGFECNTQTNNKIFHCPLEL